MYSNISKNQIDYETWNTYFELFKDVLSIQVQGISYYYLANTLTNAEVFFKHNGEDLEYGKRVDQLKKDISLAKSLSDTTKQSFPLTLFRFVSLSAAKRELAKTTSSEPMFKNMTYTNYNKSKP